MRPTPTQAALKQHASTLSVQSQPLGRTFASMTGISGRLRHILLSVVLLVGLLIPAVSMLGCSAEHSKLRKSGQQKEFLEESVKAYWHAVRWGYLDHALAFVESGKSRDELADYLMEEQGKATLLDFEIYGMELGPELQTADVRVSYGVLRTETATLKARRGKQEWYYQNARWFLKITPDELKRLGDADP